MSPTRMSKIESSVRVVLEFNEAFNRHSVAGMVEQLSDDCVFEEADPAPDGTLFAGKQAINEFLNDFLCKSPHAHIEIEDIFGLGERCIMRWRYSWLKDDGDIGHIRGVDIFRVRNGLITEKLSYTKGP